ncbi:MAG: hypothetical protein V4520_09660 [Bacteroidota bacterium]
MAHAYLAQKIISAGGPQNLKQNLDTDYQTLFNNYAKYVAPTTGHYKANAMQLIKREPMVNHVLHKTRIMLKTMTIVLTLLIVPIVIKAQRISKNDSFTKFVLKNYHLPDELKSNCEWMYAIVKVRTDIHNRIVNYEFVNKPPDKIKGTFNFIIGYQFSKKEVINRHPIVFYFAIDNLQGCTEKPGDKIYYAPNDAASSIWGYVTQLIKDDPKTIFLPNILFFGYGKPQP